MPKGVYERKPKEDDMAPTEPAAAQNAAQKTFPVLLNKNYVPHGAFEVVGHLRPEVKRKNAAGQWIVVQEEEFVEGEMAPPPYPGVGFAGKVWAGTTIRLPIDEAKILVAKKLADRADAISA